MEKIAVLFICFIILLAHFLTPIQYNWKINTISQLASQGYQYKLLMQIGFIGFGLILSVGLIIKMIQYRPINYLYIPIILYGLSIVVTGFFCTTPFITGVNYSALNLKFTQYLLQQPVFFSHLGFYYIFLKQKQYN